MGADKLNQPIDTNELMSLDDMANGHLDVATLGEAANEDKIVTSRKGREYPSAPMASRLLVENGLLGATPFSTYTAMIASMLVDGSYAVVTNDIDLSKNGAYQKIAGTWVFNNYNVASDVYLLRQQTLSLSRYQFYDSFEDIAIDYKYELYDSFLDEASDYLSANVALNSKDIYVIYKHVDKSISIIWQHTSNMMFKIIWEPNGHNSLFNFKSISHAAGSNPKTHEWSVIQEVTTDYIPPVTFLATTGATSESGTATTGGNHGTSGGDGLITAHMMQCDFYINGSKLAGDYSGIVESAQCRWTNKLYAGNTVNEQRYALVQDVSADFSRAHVGIILKTTALEPIEITTEGGTQIVGTGWDEAASFYGGETKGFYKDTLMSAGTKTTAPNAWAVVLKSPIYGYMAAYIDRGFGVKLSKIGVNDSIAFKNNNSWKFYNFTMRGYPTPQTMVANESHTWRGGYAYAPLDITDLESAFIAKFGTKTAIGFEALAGQKGAINLPSYLVGNDYKDLDTSPDGAYINANAYITSLSKEV
ncbi:hypothetical protein ACQKDA_00025 [Psychrobacter sp. NPDC078370]|uniref:hypothetical protein n=1 Tax=unclassified Psychrobacter TaxID=196806 RepID=UPI003D07FB61